MFKKKNKHEAEIKKLQEELKKIDAEEKEKKELEALKSKVKVSKSKKQEHELPEGYKEHDVIKSSFVNKIKDKLMPDKTMLVNMELRNGMHTQFMINTKKQSFSFMGGTYVIDTEMKYYMISSRLYALDYHQDISIPLKRKFNTKLIKEGAKVMNPQVETAMNSKVLEDFIESKVAEGIMKGQQFDDFLKNIKFMIFVTLVATIIHLLLYLYKSGVFSGLNI